MGIPFADLHTQSICLEWDSLFSIQRTSQHFSAATKDTKARTLFDLMQAHAWPCL